MKKIAVVICSCLLLAVSSCNRDIPNDIPEWLEVKVKASKKNAKERDHCLHNCVSYSEYSDGSRTIFKYSGAGPVPATTVYDYNGNVECTYYPYDTAMVSCGSIAVLADFHLVRTIWQE